MPPAKKPSTRRSTAKKSGSGSVTRREVEATTKRFEKALDDAGTALQSMGSNFGRNAKSTYREIERALKQVRRDAGKANRTVMKDLEKVWAAAAPSSSTSSSRTTRSGSTSRSRSSTAKSSTAKSSGAKSTARKSTTSRSKSGSSAAGTSSAAKSGAARSRSAAKSGSAAKSSGTRRSAASGSKSRRGS